MTVEELMLKLTIAVGQQDFRVVIASEQTGDIDEIEELPIKNLVWDVAEKRLILEW